MKQGRAFYLEYGLAMLGGVGDFIADTRRCPANGENDLFSAMRVLLEELLNAARLYRMAHQGRERRGRCPCHRT